MGCAVRADVTVTMQYKKPGLLLYPGGVYAGRLVRAGIGVTGQGSGLHNPVRSLTSGDVEAFLPERMRDGNKGTFGKVLLVAGSETMPGAALLAASAAFACGAGMVKLLTVPENRDLCISVRPELMIRTFSSSEEACAIIDEELNWCDAAAAGPGMGNSPRTEAVVRRLLLSCKKPLILDADALNVLSGRPELIKSSGAEITITPHIGEMSRLTGKSTEDIKSDLISAAACLAEDTGVICHLKDGRSVTAVPDGRIFINTSGNAGMASAGSGDVLTGMLSALAAACKSAYISPECPAAALAAFLHGCAGDRAADAAGMRSMTAGDIIRYLTDILRMYHYYERPYRPEGDSIQGCTHASGAFIHSGTLIRMQV